MLYVDFKTCCLSSRDALSCVTSLRLLSLHSLQTYKRNEENKRRSSTKKKKKRFIYLYICLVVLFRLLKHKDSKSVLLPPRRPTHHAAWTNPLLQFSAQSLLSLELVRLSCRQQAISMAFKAFPIAFIEFHSISFKFNSPRALALLLTCLLDA